MSTVEIIYGLVFISLGILTSWSDLKEGRVYNKILLIFGIISLILNAVYYGYYDNGITLSRRLLFGL